MSLRRPGVSRQLIVNVKRRTCGSSISRKLTVDLFFLSLECWLGRACSLSLFGYDLSVDHIARVYYKQNTNRCMIA